MNKKLTKRFLKRYITLCIVLGIAFPSCIIITKNILSYYKNHLYRIFTPKQVTYNIRYIFSEKLEHDVEEYIKNNTQEKSLLGFNPDSFYDQLKKQFPFIHSVDWIFAPPQKLQLTIIGQRPYCLINETWVLGETNELLEKLWFGQNISLPNISVNQQWIRDRDKLDKKVASFIHQIPLESLKNNHITYHAPWHIDIIPQKSICRCRIITDEKNFFAQHKFTAISSLFQNLCNQKLITPKTLQSKGVPLAFDMRIKNRVIVKFFEPTKRGRDL